MILSPNERWRLFEGSCLDVLPKLPDESVDAVVSDPPYPYVKRPYGYWEEDAWRAMIDGTLNELRRVLKPKGSALLVLQPNSEELGRMRSWLWRFLADWSDHWNVVQDLWWWNPATPPGVHAQRRIGLLRPSMKALVWLGPSDCYRNQDAVLLPLAEATKLAAETGDDTLRYKPSGYHGNKRQACAAALERGGSTPFNVLRMANTNSATSGGAKGHSAATPLELCRWAVRYLCPEGGTVLDPFAGSATVGRAALELGRRFVGIENFQAHVQIARSTLESAARQGVLPLHEPGARA